jgi:hypothetical protein
MNKENLRRIKNQETCQTAEGQPTKNQTVEGKDDAFSSMNTIAKI